METAKTYLELLARRILVIRGVRVMIDADLAEIYGIEPNALSQAIKRNANRFPESFMFQLTAEENAEAVTNCDHLDQIRLSPALPYAFTGHGAIMMASILNSKVAVENCNLWHYL